MKKSKKKLGFIINICVAVAILSVLTVLILMQTGTFNKTPVLTEKLNNSGTETITVLANRNYSPYIFEDENGEASGYDMELMIMLANHLNVNLDVVFFDSWDEGITIFENGGADILMTCDSEDEIDHSFMTVSTAVDDYVVYSKQKISTTDELFGKKIAIVSSGSVYDHLKMLGLEDYCRYYPNNQQALMAVSSGKADCAVICQDIGNAALTSMNLSDIKEQLSLGQNYMCFAVNSNREDLVLEINHMLDHLRQSGDMETLREKWLTTFVKPYTVWTVLKNNLWLSFALIVCIVFVIYFIINRIHKNHVEREEQRKQTEEKLSIIGGLSSDYTAVFHINLDTGLYKNYVLDDSVADFAEYLTKYPKFSDLYKAYIYDGYVHPDSMQQMAEIYESDEALKEKLRNQKKIVIAYKRKHGDTYLWNEMRLVKCEDINEDAHTIIAGFAEINDEYMRRLENEENERRIKTTKAAADKLIAEFDESYMINIHEDSFRSLKVKPEDSNASGGSFRFSEVFNKYADTVYEDDRDMFRESLNPDRVSEKLAAENDYSIYYRSCSSGSILWYKMRFIQLSENEVVCGILNVDDELIGKIAQNELTQSFFDVYVVDTDKNDIRIIKNDQNRNLNIISGTNCNYSEAISHFLAHVDENYKKTLEDIVTSEKLKEAVSKDGRFEMIFQLTHKKDAFFRVSIFTLENTSTGPRLICFAFSQLDDSQAEREKLNNKIAEQGAFTSFFLSVYESAFYVDLNDRSYKVYKSSDRLNSQYIQRTDFFDGLKSFANDMIYYEDREKVLGKIEPDYIVKELSTSLQYYTLFRVQAHDKMLTYRMQIIRGADEQHVVFGFRDITDNIKEQETYQRKLEDALTKARSSSEAKSAFLFNMSHDIRTPMNAIIGFTDMAIKRIDEKVKVTEYLSKVKNSGQLLLSLINGVLDMSRIESGKAELDSNPVDIYRLFDGIKDSAEEMAQEKKIEISFNFGTVNNRYVMCDYARVTRVIVNLVSNAVKYTNEGGTVSVFVEQTGFDDKKCGIYKFTVKDNGIGIGKDFISHVFEAYSRENNTTQSGVSGTGLGLTVCKAFVDAMGGTIECTSEKGVGSTFTAIIPFEIQEGRKYTDIKTGEVISAEDVQESKNDFTGKRVLLVEDNDLNREIANEILTDEGFIVDEAEDGVVAVEKIDEKGPYYYDYVLMDIQMPRMNGYEATRMIRSKYPGVRLPIIALSANAFQEDIDASKASGMNAHVAKPIDVKRLFDTMSEHSK